MTRANAPTRPYAAQVQVGTAAVASASSAAARAPVGTPSAVEATGVVELHFDQIFHEYAAYVAGLLRRLGVSDADVEDVAQEVFTAVHQRLPDFEGRSTLKTWICGIAVRRAADHRRKAARRRESACEVPELSSPASQLTTLEWSQEATLLSQALDQMSEKLRSVFVLYELEDLPMADVARALSCNRFTGYTRLRNARRLIREHFERAGHGRQQP